MNMYMIRTKMMQENGIVTKDRYYTNEYRAREAYDSILLSAPIPFMKGESITLFEMREANSGLLEIKEAVRFYGVEPWFDLNIENLEALELFFRWCTEEVAAGRLPVPFNGTEIQVPDRFAVGTETHIFPRVDTEGKYLSGFYLIHYLDDGFVEDYDTREEFVTEIINFSEIFPEGSDEYKALCRKARDFELKEYIDFRFRLFREGYEDGIPGAGEEINCFDEKYALGDEMHVIPIFSDEQGLGKSTTRVQNHIWGLKLTHYKGGNLLEEEEWGFRYPFCTDGYEPWEDPDEQ